MNTNKNKLLNEKEDTSQGITVLSLFDGISCGQIALERAGIKVDKYFASEIEESAIQVTQKHFPNTIQLGDVTKINYKNGVLYSENGEFKVDRIDLVIGGSPCQGFSFAGKQLNFNDPRSKLFFDFSRILEEVSPRFFLLENVVMKQEYKDVITSYLKTEPFIINSNVFSAQSRKRLYWTNFKVDTDLEECDLTIKDIIDDDFTENLLVKESSLKNCVYSKNYMQYDTNGRGWRSQNMRAYYLDAKCGTLTTRCRDLKVLLNDGRVRRFTVSELERLQTLPSGYTDGLGRTKATEAIGNGWTVDVIAYIFSFLKNELKIAK